MFKIKKIDSEFQLERWMWENPDCLALQGDKSGFTLTIEMSVGLQLTLWGSDIDILIEGINELAEKSAQKPRVVYEDKVKTVTVPYPVGAKGDQGYTVDETGGFASYKRIEYDKKSHKFEEESND